MKPEAKYSWALDGNDRLIHIDTVLREARDSGEFGTFHCPGCGKQMNAALGDSNRHYFAHYASKRGCGTETYLHGLMKLRLKEKFDSGEPLVISILRPTVCKDYRTCPFFSRDVCCNPEHRDYDLSKIYDTCSLEERVQSPENPDEWYVADILLSHSAGKRPPMLLEVKVTHEIGEQKASSGLLVVEMFVRSEEDVNFFVKGPIKEMETRPLPSSKGELRAHFQGPFKRTPVIGERRLNKRSLVRAVVEEDEVFQTSFEDNVECSNAGERISDSSLLEMNFDPGLVSNWRTGSPARMAAVFAADHGFRFRTDRPLSQYESDLARRAFEGQAWEVIWPPEMAR